MDPTPRQVITMGIFLILAVLGLSVIAGSCTIIDSGYRGVVISKVSGTDLTRIMGEGLNWKVPYVHRVEPISIQTQRFVAQAAGSSQDLQDVRMGITLNYKLMESELPQLRQ